MEVYKKLKGGIGFGSLYLVLIMLMLGWVSFELIGGKLPAVKPSDSNGEQVVVDPFAADKEKKNLQLYTFSGKPVPTTPVAHSCVNSSLNEEREFFIGSDPPPGGVASGGVIRVWVFDDDASPWVAPGTQTDPATGKVTVPGNYALKDRRGYAYHPALYITNITSNPNDRSGDVDNGGKAYFPDLIKGGYSYAPNSVKGTEIKSAPVDDYLNFMNGPDSIDPRTMPKYFLAEYIWEIDKLGLAKGSYRTQFVMHDGDGDLSIDCITISI